MNILHGMIIVSAKKQSEKKNSFVGCTHDPFTFAHEPFQHAQNNMLLSIYPPKHWICFYVNHVRYNNISFLCSFQDI